ncbi:hypothetical protein SERLA73DRAFT_38000, partial [Serpula lacrymans var. lacrymans S7.3]
TKLMNSNATGLRNTALPWFWSMNLKGDTSQPGYLNLTFSIKIQFTGFMKAMYNRWIEEGIMVHLKMKWTVQYF